MHLHFFTVSRITVTKANKECSDLTPVVGSASEFFSQCCEWPKRGANVILPKLVIFLCMFWRVASRLVKLFDRRGRSLERGAWRALYELKTGLVAVKRRLAKSRCVVSLKNFLILGTVVMIVVNHHQGVNSEDVPVVTEIDGEDYVTTYHRHLYGSSLERTQEHYWANAVLQDPQQTYDLLLQATGGDCCDQSQAQEDILGHLCMSEDRHILLRGELCEAHELSFIYM